MPGLFQRNAQFGNAPATPTAPGSTSTNGIWSKHRDDITFDQLQKIVMYAKSLQLEGAGMYLPNKMGASKISNDSELDEVQDPAVHPWGGLAATKDGILTLLDCFIYAKSLKTLQNVFDSARVRERERELLYPDACGGGGRGWISHGMSYGRGHGIRETCALHTARLSCDTLVDFWSALSDETRLSLLRMKEGDFMDRLMFRFESKRFCRDCRRNVIREFKELKELKRMRKEPRCTSWFCVADTAFQYEVSEDTIQADWHQSFTDTVGTYHHFEWAVGTGEGKSDILDFEDVGMNGKVQVNGLDLGGLSACFITLRAWKLDGRYTEFCVKAHALKGQQCVHRRLIVGDGFVTITKGESIRRFFEHAEEAEEEEDDDAMDKDGNELDSEGTRPQKHAKSPELAREFLLDAATVIFKEQTSTVIGLIIDYTVSKNKTPFHSWMHEIAEGSCLDNIVYIIHVTKLLEEEEKEKREEEERKERRRTKEREKKLRRKERLKGKEREREKKLVESKSLSEDSHSFLDDSPTSLHDESPNSVKSGDSVSEPGDIALLPGPNVTDEQTSIDNINMKNPKNDSLHHQCHVDGELGARDGNGSFVLEQSKSLRRKLRFGKDSLVDQASSWYDKHQSSISNESSSIQQDEPDSNGCTMSSSRGLNGLHRPSRERVVRSSARNCNMKYSDKFHCSNSRMRDRFDFQACSCIQQADYKGKDGYHICTVRSASEIKIANKTEATLDMPRSFYRSVKYNNGCFVSDSTVFSKGKHVGGTHGKDIFHTKQVWEPLNTRKKCSRSSSDPDFTLGTTVKVDPSEEARFDEDKNEHQQPCNVLEAIHFCSSDHSVSSGKAGTFRSYQLHENTRKDSNTSVSSAQNGKQKGFVPAAKLDCYSKNGAKEEVDSCPIMSTFPMNKTCDPVANSSSSDNCSSCLSEGDASTSTSSTQNAESSSTSDSEDASQQSDGRDTSTCDGNNFHKYLDETVDSNHRTNGCDSFTKTTACFAAESCTVPNFSRESSTKAVHNPENGRFGFTMAPSQQHMLSVHNQSIHVPLFPSPTMGYHNHGATSWSATPTNGLMPFSQPSQYVLHSPLGYSLQANQSSDFCMQYSALQPLSAPAFDANQHSLYRTANRVNSASSKEQYRNLDSCGFHQVNAVGELIGRNHPLEKSFPSRQVPSKPPSEGQHGSVENASRSHNDSRSFSLFHFGGPVDGVAAGFNPNSLSIEEETTGGFVSKLPAAQAHTCSKEETKIEEYSLFSARSGVSFSFF
ncbi:hornerin-like [Cocos nucifera]|nr:hornerin-like [Cocos nucifera]